MKIISRCSAIDADTNTVSQLVSHAMVPYQETFTQQNISLVNDVSPELQFFANEEVFLSILNRVLLAASHYSDNSEIKISAKSFHNILLLHIKVSDVVDEIEILSQLRPAQLTAKKMGGFLDITSRRSKLTTISFTVLNSKSSRLVDNTVMMYLDPAA